MLGKQIELCFVFVLTAYVPFCSLASLAENELLETYLLSQLVLYTEEHTLGPW